MEDREPPGPHQVVFRARFTIRFAYLYLSRLVSFIPQSTEMPKTISIHKHFFSLCIILVSESVVLSLCPKSSHDAGLDCVFVLVVFHLHCTSHPMPIQFVVRVLVELRFVFAAV